jgi:hypothetical protein
MVKPFLMEGGIFMLKRVLPLLLLVLIITLQPGQVNALSCASLPSIDKAYEEYDGVIVGYVEDMTRNSKSNVLQLKVVTSYKGVEDAGIKVAENITWGSLDGPSVKGEEYLFFLRKKDGGWENPLCAPTKKKIDASAELAYLKDKEIPLKSIAVQESTTESAPEEIKSMNWTLIIAILTVVLGVIAYGMIRYLKRASR